MDKTCGRVLSVLPGGGSATVEVDSSTFCARCAAGKGCGAGLLGNERGPRQFEAPVVGRLELRTGDEVQIELAPRNVLVAALIVYGTPLAGMLAAAILAYLAGMTDSESLLTVAGGLTAGIGISRWRLRRSNCLRQLTPAITQRLAGPP